MPYGTDATALKDAVRAFAKKTFADYRYVMALHQDTDNPHVHLTVQNCGMHGKRLQIKRGDPQKWREAFALELDKRGINAEATPRAIRGIVLKSVSQTLKHMKGRGVKLHTAKEAIDDIRFLWTQNKQTIQPRPWETAIQIKQKAIRNNWLALAETFKATDKYLSDQIIDFVKKMPDPCTKRESINQKIFESIRDKTRACQLLQDHPELKADIDKIHAAEHYANAKYIDNQQKEQFMQRVITDIAHKRINGKGLQSIQFDTDKPPKQKRNNLDKDFER
jgi:type IV secretion system T-DNA border endonuclease VirD2